MLKMPAMREGAARVLASMDLSIDTDQPVSALSVAEQQMVEIAKALASDATMLILDEPTQGIDVGAKAEIHALMTELAAQGVAILMISSELPEILGMSDRIAVLRGGTIVGVLHRAQATQQDILALALGHSYNFQPMTGEQHGSHTSNDQRERPGKLDAL